MSAVGFEPTIPASARPQTYALDRAASGIDNFNIQLGEKMEIVKIYLSVYQLI
jgi:hypothetical protein